MAYDPLIALILPISTAPFIYLLYRLWSSRPAMVQAIGGYLGLGARDAPTLVLGLGLATLYLVGLWVTVAAAALRQETGIGPRLLLSLLLSAAVPLLNRAQFENRGFRFRSLPPGMPWKAGTTDFKLDAV
jgi:hypothetical protein